MLLLASSARPSRWRHFVLVVSQFRPSISQSVSNTRMHVKMQPGSPDERACMRISCSWPVHYYYIELPHNDTGSTALGYHAVDPVLCIRLPLLHIHTWNTFMNVCCLFFLRSQLQSRQFPGIGPGEIGCPLSSHHHPRFVEASLAHTPLLAVSAAGCVAQTPNLDLRDDTTRARNTSFISLPLGHVHAEREACGRCGGGTRP